MSGKRAEGYLGRTCLSSRHRGAGPQLPQEPGTKDAVLAPSLERADLNLQALRCPSPAAACSGHHVAMTTVPGNSPSALRGGDRRGCAPPPQGPGLPPAAPSSLRRRTETSPGRGSAREQRPLSPPCAFASRHPAPPGAGRRAPTGLSLCSTQPRATASPERVARPLADSDRQAACTFNYSSPG